MKCYRIYMEFFNAQNISRGFFEVISVVLQEGNHQMSGNVLNKEILSSALCVCINSIGKNSVCDYLMQIIGGKHLAWQLRLTHLTMEFLGSISGSGL